MLETVKEVEKKGNVKINFTLEQAMRAYNGEKRYSFTLSLTWVLYGDERKKERLSNSPLSFVARSRNKVALGRDGAASRTRQQHVPIVLHSASR